ncbi:methylated-DNA--[protein]-cysteine S-methyltransferase [Leuconostoc kimchii IMSNU 11154]|uniref:Methylated-DNA--[protein]-cysteine S-methyltransferase n=1 Tax=Leuconostoc kimchii (strain IMSNU 11154 / KCTC 2386 / IH25) TaxID=762051 RepID=D5T5C0_LEUKI|nr:methylated-DNA--[protein]-cysteine S-methyltransferase [Leuconostoc kimchii]ADG41250.1 methylated-DNA--[protein]-cysteine S-methyltransferase [Leuconostoc kimchii IMSNU 11154]
MITYDTAPFLGRQLTLFKSQDALVFISLADDAYANFYSFYPDEQVTRAEIPELHYFERYAAGQFVDWSQLKTAYLKGTPFQRDVWQAMREMKLSETLTYSELAVRAQHPTAIRAVASAVGKNPLTIINPCHRILPKSGGIGKFRYGSVIKQAILALDQQMILAK